MSRSGDPEAGVVPGVWRNSIPEYFSPIVGFGPQCIETCNIYPWHLHSVCMRCSSINGRRRLSIDGGLFLSIDDGVRMSIDLDVNRDGRM